MRKLILVVFFVLTTAGLMAPKDGGMLVAQAAPSPKPTPVPCHPVWDGSRYVLICGGGPLPF